MTVGNLSVLGSTGSIGDQTLEVVRANRERFRVVALAGNANAPKIIAQAREFTPELVAVADADAARQVRAELGPSFRVETGPEALEHAVTLRAVHTVVAGVVGFACLPPVLSALRAGKHIALANKECLVAAGDLVRSTQRGSTSCIVPVDSEHNSVFQCLDGRPSGEVRRVILTASGGPFFRSSARELERVTPESAVKHPRWNMGAKISVDSATLMNKGFEVIEAAYLFDLPPEQIAVLIHPQSIVHGFVEYTDSAVLACLYEPDMRLPISYALGYLSSDDPARAPNGRVANNLATPLDLARHERLEFYPPDLERFPLLGLAYEALRAGGNAGTVLNAANEVAVSRFLEGRIAFLDIPRVVRVTMDEQSPRAAADLESIRAVDTWARSVAERIVQRGS